MTMPELLIDLEGELWLAYGDTMLCLIDEGADGLKWGTEIRTRQDIERAYGPLRHLLWPPTTATTTTATDETTTRYAAAFTEWDRRYREEPERFTAESVRLLRGTPETYGDAAAPYFAQILDEQSVHRPD
jgi:hypothetical protein